MLYSAKVQGGDKTELTALRTLRASHPLSKDVLYVSVRQSSDGTMYPYNIHTETSYQLCQSSEGKVSRRVQACRLISDLP